MYLCSIFRLLQNKVILREKYIRKIQVFKVYIDIDVDGLGLMSTMELYVYITMTLFIAIIKENRDHMAKGNLKFFTAIYTSCRDNI